MMVRYSLILFKLIIVLFYYSYRLFKHILKNNFFVSCDRFLFLSEQILKLSEVENFDLSRKIRIKQQMSMLEFENFQCAVEYIEEVSKELQMPSEYEQLTCDSRFKLYNERLESMRMRAAIMLKSVRSDS